MPVVVWLNAGNQLPVIPLSEVIGNAGMVAPAQYSVTMSNVGVTISFISIVTVAVVAHPEVGVKV